MVIELGANPTILIALSFLEIFLILIPVLVSSKIEKSSVKTEFNNMGFKRNKDKLLPNIFKGIFGLNLGILFFLISSFVMIFYRNIIIENLLGPTFVEEGQEDAISTNPINPTIFQIVILILMQLIIIGPCEEGFFRGFILQKCGKKIKKVYAVIISSTCFTFFHIPPFIVPITTIVTFFGYYLTFGILIGLTYVIFDYSLIPCSIAHSFFNILVLVL